MYLYVSPFGCVGLRRGERLSHGDTYKYMSPGTRRANADTHA
jgi:hypothetical protein